MPDGTNGLDKDEIAQYPGDIFEQDARICLRRAEVMAEVALSLDEEQRELITGIIPRQKPLLQEIVRVRQQVSEQLRKYLDGGEPDRALVLSLGRRYGELDGEMSFLYASAFARVNQTLTTEQRAVMEKLRNLPGYTPAPYYLYSQAMKRSPTMGSTDSFFSADSEAPLR